MALPAIDQQYTLDVTYLGAPFMQVASKACIDLSSLDVAYLGAPFWGLSPVTAGGVYPMKRYNGSTWVDCLLKCFTGAAFLGHPVKVYSEGSWKEVNNS